MNQEDRLTLSPQSITIQTIANIVEGVYGFELDSKPVAITRGVESAAWSIKTAEGEYYVKVYGQHEGSKERIADEVQLYDFLRKHSVCVPVVKENKNNERVTEVEYEGLTFFMIVMEKEELKEVEPLNISNEQMSTIARSVAQLHIALRYYPYQHLREHNDSIYQPPKPSYDILVDSPNAQFYSSPELIELKNLEEQMLSYMNKNPVGNKLTESVIHADLGFGHMQFLPSGEIYFFDFADRFFGPLAHELAILIQNIYRTNTISVERFESLRKIFLDNYLVDNPLSKEDLDAIPWFILRHVIDVSRYMSVIAKNINEEADGKGIKRRFELARYLLKNI